MRYRGTNKYRGVTCYITRDFGPVNVGLLLECSGTWYAGRGRPDDFEELEIAESRLVELDFAKDEDEAVARAHGLTFKVGDNVELTDDEFSEVEADVSQGAAEHQQGLYEAACDAKYDEMREEGRL